MGFLGMKIFKKEKEVADLALEYLDVATQCVSAGEAAVLAYLNGNLEEASIRQKEASELESAADISRRTIGDLLFLGAYLPLIRGDIFAVIESLDKMPNASESCAGFFLGEKPQVPEEFRAAFLEVTVESFGAMEDLRKAVKAFFKPKGDIEKIRVRAHEVGTKETRVDEMEWALTVLIFESETLDLSQKRHLKTALDRIEHLSDVAENVADRLEMAAMKSVL
jgi:predicted phosphate transport protein (TIGR00153 family)